MSDFRVFCPTTERQSSSLKLSPEESHHLVTVNRARVGDTITAFDGRGAEWTCELADSLKSGATLLVTAAHARPPLPCAVTLAQALPKGGVMDDIVRHATELGAARIVPIESERTQVHLDDGRSGKKVDKWRVTALEAAKQCGNPFLPEIAGIQPLDTFLAVEVARPIDLRLVASLHPGARPLRERLAEFRAARGTAPASVTWLVGPEGDFSPTEMERIIAAGFTPVTLGPLVLRCDTAATMALGVILNESLG